MLLLWLLIIGRRHSRERSIIFVLLTRDVVVVSLLVAIVFGLLWLAAMSVVSLVVG